MKKNLTSLRKRVDSLDARIVKFLVQRARVTLDIARSKRGTAHSIYCPDREQDVLYKVTHAARPPLSPEALSSIYREIMSASLALEKDLTIAFLGPDATFTHQAALKRFGSRVSYRSCDSIASVFNEVEKGAVDYGVVPIENSIEGAVNHTLDMFVDSDLKICSQVILDITQNLLARCPMRQVKRIYSNPMVFGQCRAWLQKNLPAAELVEVPSTTQATQEAASHKNSAAIASLLASRIYAVPVIAGNIQDSGHNFTRFFVIGDIEPRATGHDKTSLVFSIKDKVGALHHMLLPFKKYRVNLSKIESRPSKKRAWDYYFFIDIEGHGSDPRIRRALAELENRCKFLKVLGSYPV
ncbi:MAG: prephenate dehydratase [Candidatus Omnitrophica bacterium]|nr:prephenate dehydratase [Candidatus Omnitrophota bacterium]